MSRVGKHPVGIPDGVTVSIIDNVVKVKGPKGNMHKSFSNSLKIIHSGSEIIVSTVTENNSTRSLWGTAQRIIANMVKGVSEGFVTTLDINGVGYKASMVQNGDVLKLSLGFSHDIHYIPLENITIKCTKPTEIEITGIDRQAVNQVAAEIRKFRPPEPYKGKGIRYTGEKILRKEGKKK